MSFWFKQRDKTGRVVWYSASGFQHAFALIVLVLILLFFLLERLL